MASKKEIKSLDDLYKSLDESYNIFFKPEKIRTGIVPLDLALNGYLETGSLIELSGESQTGKSTLLLHLCKNLCEKDYHIMYIDTEGSVKEDQLYGMGLMPYKTEPGKPNNFTLLKESSYNKVEDVITKTLAYGTHKVFIIDSLSALVGDIYLDLENDRNATEARIGYDALLNTKLLKKLSALKAEHNCIFIFINQTRIDMSGFFKSYKPAGGQSVKFFPDVRLFMRHKKKLLDKRELITGIQEVPIGAETTLEAQKSRLGLGFIQYPMTVYFGKGISNLNSYVSLLPNIKVKVGSKMVPLLEQPTSRTNVLHLPTGDVKSSTGEPGLKKLIVENEAEIIPIFEEYLNNYYESLHSKKENNTMPELTETIEEVVVEEEDIDITREEI